MNDTTEWISLGEAAKMLGVHPATVRNWADRGELPFRRTPGGHRRFRRTDLAQWADSQRSAQPAEAQLVVQSALGRILMAIDDGQLAQHNWYARIDENAREGLRMVIRRLMNALMGFLASAPTNNGGMRSPAEIGSDYAATFQAQGLALNETVRGFTYFNRFVIEAIIQLSETGASRGGSEWGDLLRRICAFTDEALLAIIEFYQTQVRGADSKTSHSLERDV